MSLLTSETLLQQLKLFWKLHKWVYLPSKVLILYCRCMHKAFYCVNSIAGDVSIVVSYQTNELSDLILTVITRYSIILHTRGKLSLQHVSVTYLKCVPTAINVKGNTMYVHQMCLSVSLSQTKPCKHTCTCSVGPRSCQNVYSWELFNAVAIFSMYCSAKSP